MFPAQELIHGDPCNGKPTMALRIIASSIVLVQTPKRPDTETSTGGGIVTIPMHLFSGFLTLDEDALKLLLCS